MSDEPDLAALKAELALLRKQRIGRALARRRREKDRPPSDDVIDSKNMAKLLGLGGGNSALPRYARSVGVRPRFAGGPGTSSWWNPEDFRQALMERIENERKHRS